MNTSRHLYTTVRDCRSLRQLLLALATSTSCIPAAMAELPVPAAQFVTSGAVSVPVTSGPVMDVNQLSQKAIVNWQSFNVGAANTVNFHQPGAGAVLMNRIHDLNPSRINGAMNANGQVYLINNNGIVFGDGAQVNVHGLVASSLDISDQVFEQGLTQAIESVGAPALTGGSDGAAMISVAPGARITASGDPSAPGRVILAAPKVENQGRISADDGQVILVGARDKVYLKAAPSSDPSLRGLLVEVDNGGTASNLGEIVTRRGNTTMLGLAVNQKGRISATTTVQVNGSIRLIARDRATVRNVPGEGLQAQAGRTGDLVLGEDSLTEILPELDDPELAIDAQAQPRSRIELQGHSIHLRRNSRIVAPAGEVSLTATDNPQGPAQPGGAANASRLQLDAGSRIDVSGSDDSVLAASRNLVRVELRGNELRDAPLQRDGALRNKTITVDIRKGTPLADISGARNNIQRGVGERTARGGDVRLASEGDLVVNPGAGIDVSGGKVHYRDGRLRTTRLLAQGQIIDIADARPDRIYDGILGDVEITDPRYGVSQGLGLDGGYYSAAYDQGFDAGGISLYGRRMAVAGDFLGQVVRGPFQRDPASAPAGGALTLGNGAQAGSAAADLFAPEIRLGHFPAGPGLGLGETLPTVLDFDISRLSGAGIDRFSAFSNRAITLMAGAGLELAAGGSLDLIGADLRIGGRITVPAGSVRLKAGSTVEQLTGNDLRVDAGAVIDSRGQWINDNPLWVGGQQLWPLFIHGGDLRLEARDALELASGASIRVGGGAHLDVDGKLIAGRGGDVHIHQESVGAGDLVLDAGITGYALERGGAFDLRARQLGIGGGGALDATLFRSGGFGEYQITALGGSLRVAPGTRITPRQQNLILNAAYGSLASGADLRSVSDIGRLPDFLRQPVSLELGLVHQTATVTGADELRLGEGALIDADAGASVSLHSDGRLTVLGGISAPGGRIDLRVQAPQGGGEPGYLAGQTLWLGRRARLDVSATQVLRPGPLGLDQGRILDAGTLSLAADRGFIVTETGSRMLASGGVFTAASLSGQAFTGDAARETVAAGAGNIELSAAEGMLLDGGMTAEAAAYPGAAGGGLSLDLDASSRSLSEPLNFGFGARSLVLRRDGSSVPAGLAPGMDIDAGLQGHAFLATEQVTAGGFDRLSLKAASLFDTLGQLASISRIRFDGPVDLRLRQSLALDAAGLLAAGGDVRLSAAYMNVGSTLISSQATDPASGGGARLTLDAGLLDLTGTLALQGFGTAHLRSGEDIRLRGVQAQDDPRVLRGALHIAGDLELDARQVYPTTLSRYDFNAPGHAITVRGGGDAPVYSAAGRLAMQARDIHISGTLKAPLGELALNAEQAMTLDANGLLSVGSGGLSIPFGRTQAGLDWIYPLAQQQTLLIDNPPAKRIELQADTLDLMPGSRIDISGGGDLLAYEFIPGPGGSLDILDPANAGGAFALLPGFGSDYAAFDPLESPGSPYAPGSRLQLGSGSELAAGEYTVLPARYALLPGAWLVTPQADSLGIRNGTVLPQSDAGRVVAGRMHIAGTGIQDSLYSAYKVQSGAYAFRLAEYRLHHANDFFPARAAANESALGRLPRDAGSVLLGAGSALSLRVGLDVAAAGIGAQMDVFADRLEVVAAPKAADGFVQIQANQLQGLGVASLLLGGSRGSEVDGTRITLGSSALRIDDGVSLNGAEWILAASDSLDVGAGSQLSATVPAVLDGDPLLLSGDGALLRLSSGPGRAFVHDAERGVSGSLGIAGGARLRAAGAMRMDATLSTRMEGELLMNGGALALGGDRVSLGQTGGIAGLDGLILSNDALAGLSVDELRLSSRGSFDVYGALDLGLLDLTLEGAGIAGHANAGKTAAIHAGRITLSNGLAASGPRGSGSGVLELQADTLTVGPGDFSISGFGQVGLTASVLLQGSGQGSLDAGAATVDLSAGTIGGQAGSQLSIRSLGDMHLATVAGALPVPGALGAKLELNAGAVSGNARILLPSGGLRILAGNDLSLGAGSLIDVSGRELDFAGHPQPAPAGSIELESGQGDLSLASGSLLALGAAAGGAAGELRLSARHGRITAAGRLRAAGASQEQGGRLKLDAATLDLPPGFLSGLAPSGFTRALSLRQRAGDLYIDAGDSLAALDIDLGSDAGALNLAGSLDAGGASAGRIRLAAGGDVVLRDGSQLKAVATAPGERGGDVELISAHGRIRQQSGAMVDLGAGSGGEGGRLRLRAARVGNTAVAIDPLPGGDILGASRIEVEAVRAYDNVGSIGSGLIGAIHADTLGYMANTGAITSALGMGGDARFALLPGIELRGSGDMSLDSGWDLLGWRFGGEPGLLTLRAAGNLSLNQSLSDGFGTQNIGGMVTDTNYLQEDRSWAYRLVAGADLTAADPLAWNGGSGDLSIAASTRIRTGTGDIELAAGGRLTLAADTSVLYTAGRAESIDRWGGGDLSGFPGLAYFAIPGEYPVDGGDIRAQVGGGIQGAVTHQFVTDWQYRIGGGVTPTAWAVTFNDPAISGRNHLFRENIGALGGGDVSIHAGGDIRDLSVMIPTTGKQQNQTRLNFSSFALELTGPNDVLVQGGGKLELSADGDVTGGSYYLGRGQARIDAGGRIGKSAQTGLAPVLALGDAGYQLSARGDVRLEGALNPTAITQGFVPMDKTFFFTYGADSSVRLQSIAGNIHVGYGVDALKSAYALSFRGFEDRALGIAPPVFNAVAMQGSVVLENPFTLFPSASGGFGLFAGRDIVSADASSVVLNLSDSDPALLPTPELPQGSFNASADRLSTSGQASIIHAAVPLHQGDRDRAALVALNGNIEARGTTFRFQSSKALDVFAGRDIVDLGLDVQNVNAGDVTLIRAGRDIRYNNKRDGSGRFKPSGASLAIAGPGRADILAGRNIDLGASVGIVSIGDLQNPSLADRGADLTVMAGVPLNQDYNDFIDRFLEPAQVSVFMQALMGGALPAPDRAMAGFRALSTEQQRPLVMDGLFGALIHAGTSGAFEGGYQAIDSLFPVAGLAGNLTMFTSKVHTQDGGDINLLVPNGMVNAGLATSISGGKDPSQLGVVAQRDGDIRALVRDDFLVNQSRVFALDGGDIVMWSSRGNIDAGRGAKTAIATPPPVVTFDASGNLQVEFPPAISGSGIRGAVSTPGRAPGDVFLFAPTGVVSAGDAGIGSAGNITIAATEVIGADNIDVGGVSVGVPSASAGSLGAGLSGVGNVASSASKAAESSASDAQSEEAEQAPVSQPVLHVISVEVLGFGEDDDERKNT